LDFESRRLTEEEVKDVIVPVKPDKKEGIMKEAEWRDQWKAYNGQYYAIQQDHKVRLLLKWFKEDFFQWVNGPECRDCKVRHFHQCADLKGETKIIGISLATEAEKRYTARDVELWRCTKCGRHERFPRYNDPIKLLSTRRGRCGEFANVLPRRTLLMIVFCDASSQYWGSNTMGMEF
jgi:hypothetical protein